MAGEGDFDPEQVPIVPAATVMLLDDRPDLQVLMVRRTSRVVFGPDHWVFPGGRVDPGDGSDGAAELCVGMSDEQASEVLGVEQGGLAWWVAVCRETLEEAGLLLAADADPGLDVAALRDDVRRDTEAFVDLMRRHQVTLDAGALDEVARFVTPLGSPRRFDTRFFVARAPAGQDPHYDDGEIVNLAWLRPVTALDRWRDGEMAMMSPTVRMLTSLAAFDSANAVLAHAQDRPPYQDVRVADPHGQHEILLPGEPGYETAVTGIETGWIRLDSDRSPA